MCECCIPNTTMTTPMVDAKAAVAERDLGCGCGCDGTCGCGRTQEAEHKRHGQVRPLATLEVISA